MNPEAFKVRLHAFKSHKTTHKLFDHCHHQYLIVLADTYGLTSIRLGIERFAAITVPSITVPGITVF